MRSHSGYTLLELTLVLTLAALLAGAGTPALLHARNVMSVRAARAETVSAFAAARATAILAGGAALHIDAPASAVWIETAAGRRAGSERALGAQYGVVVQLERAEHVVVRYDALGIGRLANTTVRIRRGRVAATLTVSAYGRVRT
jgi:prepilin-type N-terminal cleavage/methylation domain-containing protein